MKKILTLSIIMISNSCSLYAVDIFRIGCVNPIYINDAPINEMLKAEENVIKEYNDKKAIESKLKNEVMQRYLKETDELKKAEIIKELNNRNRLMVYEYGGLYYTGAAGFAKFSISASVPKGYKGKLWLAFEENTNYRYLKLDTASKIDLENVSFCFDRYPSFSVLEIYNNKDRSFHSLGRDGNTYS